MKLNSRVRGIIIRDKKILLIHRIKDGREYYSIPGGGIEEDETSDEAIVREIKEETNINVEKYSELFNYKWFDSEKDETKDFTYYLIEKYYCDEIKLGSPETERHCEENQYILEWHDFEKFFDLPNYYQPEVIRRLKELVSIK